MAALRHLSQLAEVAILRCLLLLCDWSPLIGGQTTVEGSQAGGVPEVDNSPVVGWVISRLEVVQHAFGLCQHKVPLLPLERLPQGDALPATVLAHPLL